MHFLIVLIGSVLCCTFADESKVPDLKCSHCYDNEEDTACKVSSFDKRDCVTLSENYHCSTVIGSFNRCYVNGTCGCRGWRQTGNCDPNGPREPQNDKGCFATIDFRDDLGQMIESKVSGYCECADGRKTMQKGCSWGSHHTCKAACCNEKRQITRDGLQCVNWRFKGKSYDGCSFAGSSSRWCATSTTSTWEYNDWNWCDETGIGHD